KPPNSAAAGAAGAATSRCGAGPVSLSCASAPLETRRSAATNLRSLLRMAILRLPKELRAGRVIRAVNLRMAVHAGASNHAVAAAGHLRSVVDRRRMPAADVASLAEHRRLRDEHAVVVRTVRIVAAGAVLAAGRVLPEERAALLGVAARA